MNERNQRAAKLNKIQPQMQLLEGALQFVKNMKYDRLNTLPLERTAFLDKVIDQCKEKKEKKLNEDFN